MVSSLRQLNVKQHVIPHIPCGKVSEDNYRLIAASHLKWAQGSSKFIVLRMLATAA